MSGFMIFVNVIGYGAALAAALVLGGWWWLGFAVMVILDVVSVAMKKKAAKAQHDQELEQLRREIWESRQKSAPDPTPAAAPAPAPKPPVHGRKVSLPGTAGGCGIAYRYDDVSFDVIRTGAGYATVGEAVQLRADGDDVILSQSGHDIGKMQDTRLRGMVHDWDKHRDPVRAALVSYPFRGSTGMIALAFYRDELKKLRENKNAFTARIGAPDIAALTEDAVGSHLSVYRDPERERYVLTMDDLDVGMLPKSAVERLQDQDREPEDVRYLLDSVKYDEESDKFICRVLIV